jgi:hypothetical protein
MAPWHSRDPEAERAVSAASKLPFLFLFSFFLVFCKHAALGAKTPPKPCGRPTGHPKSES